MASFGKYNKGRPFDSSSLLRRSHALQKMHAERLKRHLATRQRIGLLKDKDYNDPLSEVERKMLDHELAIAEEIQYNLLPKRIPPLAGYDLGAYYRPSHEVGGDYYDFIEIDKDHLGVLVADVSGKGIPGSMVMTEARALVRCEALRTLSPAETLIKVNRFLHADLKRGMFVSLFYGVLDVPKGTLNLTSAGHNPMVLWRASSSTLHLVNPGGLALGIDKGPLFEKVIKEQKLQLFKGDRFVLYTDGAVEMMNADSQPFGQERFYMTIKSIVDRSSNEFISLLVKAIEEYQGEAPQHDDVTLVTGRMLPDKKDEL